MKVLIHPRFESEDKGDGGIRRVVEAQRKHLPGLGVTLVDTPEEADLIACHISIPTKWLRKYPEKVFVAHNHGLYWSQYEWAAWALKANKGCLDSIRAADASTVPSRWVALTAARHTSRPLWPIPHGVDIEDWDPDPKKKFVLWNKTRVDAVCNPEDMQRLADIAPKVKFISTFGKETKNVEIVDVTGLEEAKGLIKSCAVYLCTTRETFGIGTIEAMAAGSPVLGWRWGGQVEIIEHKKTGYLATPGDYDDLAEGLQFCITNHDEMGKAAREAVIERYQWKDIIPQYATMYNHALQRRLEPRPRVSVVVPAYNLAEFLPETLDSIKDQTSEDFECIIVDDASTDDTPQIADEYASSDPRFRVIHNKENLYLSGALNVGIGEAKGRYIIPVDADNMLTPDALEILAGALDTRRDIHIAYGNVEFLEEDGKRWHSGWPPKFRPEWQVLRRREDGNPSNTIPSTAMFRREVWENTGGYRRRWRTSEDADFWTRASSYGFLADMVTGADVFVYRNRENSMSRVEKFRDYTAWMPWTRNEELLPAGYPQDGPGVSNVRHYDQPRVSIIIPVGPDHTELYIDAVDSAIAQSYENWELIIVNDSGKELRWRPPFARVLDTKGGVGVARARNIGIGLSRAPFFVPLDADDTLEPLALEEFLLAWRPGHYVYSSWIELFTDEKKIWHPPAYNPDKLKGGAIHAVTALYPRQAWEEVGGFADVPWEDWDFQIALAHKCICGIHIESPLFTYRKDTGTRREEMFATKDKNRDIIQARWPKFLTKEGTLVGCGCGGKSVSPQTSTMIQRSATKGSSDSYAIVEYTGARAGAVSYKGKSGATYRFSSQDKQKFVRKEDVELFEMQRDFRVVSVDEPEGAAV